MAPSAWAKRSSHAPARPVDGLGGEREDSDRHPSIVSPRRLSRGARPASPDPRDRPALHDPAVPPARARTTRRGRASRSRCAGSPRARSRRPSSTPSARGLGAPCAGDGAGGALRGGHGRPAPGGAPSATGSATGNATVFESRAVSPPGGDQSFRAIVMGDSGRGLPGQWALAKALGGEPTTLLVHTGDVVYPRGREAEYTSFHFPVYNADPGVRSRGIGLLRTVPSVAAPGNHDTAYRNGSRTGSPTTSTGTSPCGARRAIWRASRRGGPSGRAGTSRSRGGRLGGRCSTRTPTGTGARRSRARGSTASSRKRGEVRLALRGVAPAGVPLEQEEGERALYDVGLRHPHPAEGGCGVQRARPQLPAVVPHRGGGRSRDAWIGASRVRGRRAGRCTSWTAPGGAELYDQMLAARPSTWKPFTAKYVAGYSFTRLEVWPSKLQMTQVGIGGKVLDRFSISR